MTQITLQDGKVVLVDGKVGSGAACCCEEGCCVIDGEINDEYTTQEQCESCTVTFSCFEEFPEPEGGCPEGYESFDGTCYRQTSVASCEDCDGYCEEASQEGPCGTWTTSCHVCCKESEEVDGEYSCSTEETTREQCEESGGIWTRAASCDNAPCQGCGVPTETITGWFIPQNETDLQQLAANAGWTVEFTYPDYSGGYCPGLPQPCPGPFTDECGQTWTTATFTGSRAVCEFCGTESVPQFGYGVGGNYFPSVPGWPGNTPCEDLQVFDVNNDYTIDKLCDENPLP